MGGLHTQDAWNGDLLPGASYGRTCLLFCLLSLRTCRMRNCSHELCSIWQTHMRARVSLFPFFLLLLFAFFFFRLNHSLSPHLQSLSFFSQVSFGITFLISLNTHQAGKVLEFSPTPGRVYQNGGTIWWAGDSIITILLSLMGCENFFKS